MSFPRIKRLHWRKSKTLAMLANRRQWQREYLPEESPEIEINSGISTIVTEASTAENPVFIELE